jgi:hypothetical protein
VRSGEEEEEEEEVNLSRFLSSDRYVFKLVFGGSNVLGLAPNLVSSFLTLMMLPSSKSMIMLKKMIMVSKKHQYQIVHQQLHSDGPRETVFLTLGMHQTNIWCYCLMVRNLSVFQRQ